MGIRWDRYILCAIIFVVSLLCCGYASAQSDTYSTLPDSTSRTYRHIDALKQLSIRRDTTTAMHIWQDIVAQDSTYAPALYYLSLVDGSRERMLDYARRAYLADSTNKWYTENYANKLIYARAYDAAVPVFRRLIRLDGKHLQSYHALALIYGAKEMPYSAISILDSAELRIGYNSYLGQIKQHLLIETRQFDRAIEEGKRRVREHPYDVEARRALATAYDASGNDSLAIRSYEEAFRLDTTNLETIGAISEYYYSKGNERRMLNYEERLFKSNAIAVDEKLRRLEVYTSDTEFYRRNYLQIGGIIQQLAFDYPNNPKVIDAYATHMIACGEYDYALDYLRRHLDDDTATAESYIVVLQFEHFLQRNDLIDIDLRAALERYGDNLELLSFSGFVHSERGNYKQAIDTFKEGIELTKDNGERSRFWGYIGDVYHEMGEDNRAFKAYRKALSFDANNIMVLNNYAYFLSLKNRDLEHALKMSHRAITQEPNNASYVDTYAWILHCLGRNEEAKRYMRQALTLSSQRDASLLAHYGDILWALGEKFMAETYWQKAVERGYDSTKMEQHILEIKNREQ